jgi:DNA-binding protein HU-beta
MNKGELVDAIATKTEMSKKQIDQVLSVILEVIQETVAGGEKITFVGFGSFEARHRSAREGGDGACLLSRETLQRASFWKWQ